MRTPNSNDPGLVVHTRTDVTDTDATACETAERHEVIIILYPSRERLNRQTPVQSKNVGLERGGWHRAKSYYHTVSEPGTRDRLTSAQKREIRKSWLTPINDWPA